MGSRLVYLRPTELAFVRVTGPYSSAAPRAWERVLDWLSAKGPHTYPGVAYGLLLDDPRKTAPESCRYDACLELNQLDPRSMDGFFSTRRLPGGVFARQRHQGPYASIDSTIRELRNAWIASHGLAIDPRRPFVEIFLDDPRRVAPDRLRTECCIPVIAAPGDFVRTRASELV